MRRGESRIQSIRLTLCFFNRLFLVTLGLGMMTVEEVVKHGVPFVFDACAEFVAASVQVPPQRVGIDDESDGESDDTENNCNNISDNSEHSLCLRLREDVTRRTPMFLASHPTLLDHRCLPRVLRVQPFLMRAAHLRAHHLAPNDQAQLVAYPTRDVSSTNLTPNSKSNALYVT